MTDPAGLEELLRTLTPQALGALVRRYGHFDQCEDAVQEALLAAALRWPRDGLPDNPRAWLISVASRRLVDQIRSDEARRRREAAVAAGALPTDQVGQPADEALPPSDDTMILLFLCCHPVLTPSSQMALTLRAVGGLSTAEIAHAFLVPETTMGQRISRAKQRIKETQASFRMPAPDELDDRLQVVLHVLYLIFNEGYTATSGTALARVELSAEAIRLTRQLHRLLPADGEVAGLLALMLLTDARRVARTTRDGSLVPLAAQDRTLWDKDAIAEGVDLVTAALPRGPVGRYQLQAAIAAIHDEATTEEETDWQQILALYDLLDRIAPGPMVTLNRAVAVGMVDGPQAGLDALSGLDSQLGDSHRLLAVRAHLLELTGDRDAAISSYIEAARRTTSLPEKRYLNAKAIQLQESQRNS